MDPDGMQAGNFDAVKDNLTFNNGYFDVNMSQFGGAANFSGFYSNSEFGKGIEHDPPGGKTQNSPIKDTILPEMVIDRRTPKSSFQKAWDTFMNEGTGLQDFLYNNPAVTGYSSGEYGPMSMFGDGSGMSVSVSIFGNAFGLSIAGEHYKGWGGTGVYATYSAGHDGGLWSGIKHNTSVGKLITVSATFDTYYNKGFKDNFEEGVKGYSNDVFFGFGGVTGGYSRPFDPSSNKVNPRMGLYKSSIGISTPAPSAGLSRTRTIKLF